MPGVRISRLHAIAALLDTSVEALGSADQHHILHASDDGDCWMLLRGPEGAPIVRHVGSTASGQHVTDRSVALFMLRDIGSPQHEALFALLNRLLSTYLAE